MAKRFIVFVSLFLILTVSLLAGDFTFDLTKDGKGVVITEYTGPGGNVTVPGYIEGYPVVEIGERAFGTSPFGFTEGPVNPTLRSVVLPNTIKKIGKAAFSNCINLTSINFPNSLIEMGHGAFNNTGLVNIKLPEGIKLGHGAFRRCTRLVSVTFPATLILEGGFTFYNCSNLTDIIIPNNAKITFVSGGTLEWENYGNFSNCGKLKLSVRSRLQALGYTDVF
jgi:hypothetical protein